MEDNELCAFELLAAVAGKLLQESESSACSNAAEEKSQLLIRPDGNEKVQPKHDDEKALKSESLDHGSCAESAFVPEISVEEHNLLSNFKGSPQAEKDYAIEQTSVRASSEFLEKIDCDIKLGICEDKNADGNATSIVGGSVCVADSVKVENGSKDAKNQIGYLSMANISTVNDPIGDFVNNNVLINSEGSVKSPLYKDPSSGALLQKQWNNVKLGTRDDDENSFGCTKYRTKTRPYRLPHHIGQNRMRKAMTSKYWKSAPKLRDCELYNNSKWCITCLSESVKHMLSTSINLHCRCNRHCFGFQVRG